MAAQESGAAEGLCLLWHRVVEVVLFSYPAAPEPADNLLGELEAEIAAGAGEDPARRQLSENAEVAELAPVRSEYTRVALHFSPDRLQLMPRPPAADGTGRGGGGGPCPAAREPAGGGAAGHAWSRRRKKPRRLG